MKDKWTQDQEGQDEAYIPKSFLEAQLELAGWRDILATVDVYEYETIPIVFYDEEGYDIIPIKMVVIIPRITEKNEAIP